MTALAPAPQAASPAPAVTASSPFIKWFRELSIGDIPLVGGKNASLGEMFRELAPKGVRVPDGFAVTSDAYRHFLRSAGLDEEITRLLGGLDTGDMDNLRDRGHRVRHAILAAHLPADLEAAIIAAYRELSRGSAPPADVAVRSSATAEDLPDASFAGQQETYLNVQGERALLETCKRCFASQTFTSRCIPAPTSRCSTPSPTSSSRSISPTPTPCATAWRTSRRPSASWPAHIIPTPPGTSRPPRRSARPSASPASWSIPAHRT